MVFNEPRAQKRFYPASTYKIPHTLFALDAGLVKDESQGLLLVIFDPERKT